MDNLKILMGSSVSPMEMDDEDLYGTQEEASNQYDVNELVDSINTPEFKEIYLNNINNMKSWPVSNQKAMCIKILEKIEELFEFVFIPKPEFKNQLDINNLYEFLEFIHFNCISFLSDVWKFLKVDLKDLNIRNYCEKNSSKILSEVDDQIKSRDLNELITFFLRTYYKYGFIKWFTEITEKYRMLIVLRILEGVNYDRSE